MGINAADGSTNVTVVDGTSTQGLYAPDGSMRVVLANGAANGRVQHPSGAMYVTTITNPTANIKATDGSLNVSVDPYVTGSLRVTAVSGDLGGGNPNIVIGDLTAWTTARANVLAGTGDAKVLVLGESTSRGLGAGTSGSLLNVGCDIGAWPTQLAPALTTDGLTSIHNGWIAGNFGSGGTDSRVSGTNWAYAGNATLGGPTFRNNTNTNTMSFVPTGSFNNIEIGYMTLTGQGTFTFNVDDGASLGTVDTSTPNNNIGLATATVALGTHTINIVPSTTNIQIMWVRTWNSAVKTAQIYNAGRSGAVVGDIVNTTGGSRSCLSAITKFDPDLTICCMGANDQVAATDETTFKANLQTLYNTASAAGSVILGSTTPFFNNTTGEAGRLQYADWTKDVAIANNCSFVDLTRLMGTYATALANGWMSSAVTNGDLHMSATGYAQVVPYISTVMLDGL